MVVASLGCTFYASYYRLQLRRGLEANFCLTVRFAKTDLVELLEGPREGGRKNPKHPSHPDSTETRHRDCKDTLRRDDRQPRPSHGEVCHRHSLMSLSAANS